MNVFGGAVVCFVIDVMKPLLSPRLLHAALLPEQPNTSKSIFFNFERYHKFTSFTRVNAQLFLDEYAVFHECI